MAQWQMKIDFTNAKKQYIDEEIDVKNLAVLTVKCLRKHVEQAQRIDYELGGQLDEIIQEFENIAHVDSELDIDDYDNVLVFLYDWADTSLDNHWNGKKMAWIAP